MVIEMFLYGEKNEGKMCVSTLEFHIICTCSFEFWMFHIGYDTFAMVVNFINISWESTHVTIGIFQVDDIISVGMGIQVTSLLDTFCLLGKVIAYVKNEIFNLSILIFALIYVFFVLPSTNISSCGVMFGHAMSKVAQYVIDDTDVYVKFSKVSLKEV